MKPCLICGANVQVVGDYCSNTCKAQGDARNAPLTMVERPTQQRAEDLLDAVNFRVEQLVRLCIEKDRRIGHLEDENTELKRKIVAAMEDLR